MTNPSKVISLRTKVRTNQRREKRLAAMSRTIAEIAGTVVTTIAEATTAVATRMAVILAVATAAVISLAACSPSNDVTQLIVDYNSVCDVSINGWHETDSLIYPIILNSPATLRYPLQVGLPYSLRYNIRITPQFGYTSVPMQLIVQQTDTVEGGRLHVVRNMLRQEINPAVRDSVGRPLGGTWGSLIDYEASLPDVTLRFDTVGNYRMILTPLTTGSTPFSGIASVGLLLTRRRP